MKTSVAAAKTTVLAVALCSALALAAGAQDKKAPEGAVGGANWNAKVAAEAGVAGVTLDEKQVAAVKKVSDYFNAIDNMQGTFVQTTSDNKRLRGKFYMKKPGRVRFEYSPPSKQLIISDGHQIAIQDLDISTDDRVMVDQTPFRMLLKKDVDLIRDARIAEVQETQDLLIVSLQDKSKDAAGKIRLFMALAPAVELKEWVTTDAQGLDTRVEVAGLDKSVTVDAGLFKITSPTLQKLQELPLYNLWISNGATHESLA